MAYAFVQQKESSSASSGSSISTGSFTANVTAGNLIVVAGYCLSSTMNTPTDTLGNTYTLIDSVKEAGTGVTTAWWYAKNVAGGPNNVTLTTAASTAGRGVFAIEYSGLDASAPLDVHQAQAISSGGSGANVITSGSGVSNTSTAGSLILGFGHDLQGPIENAGTSPIAFTGQAKGWSAGGSTVARFEDARLTTTGSRKATFQDTGFDRHNCLMAVFFESTGAGGSTATAAPGTGTETIAGLAPTLVKARTLLPSVGSLALQGNIVSTQKTRLISPSPALATVSGLSPTALGADQIGPTAGQIRTIGLSPELLTQRVITPSVAVLTLAGSSAAIIQQGAASASPGVSTTSVQGLAPSILKQQSVQPDPAQIVVSGAVPSLDTASDASLGRGHVGTGRRWHGRIGRYEGSESHSVALTDVAPVRADSPFQPLGGAPIFKPLETLSIRVDRELPVPPQLLAESQARIRAKKKRRRDEELILKLLS